MKTLPVPKLLILSRHQLGLPQCLSSKESACDAGDEGLTPGLGRSPGGGLGNPLQYSGLKSSMDRGAWQATVPRVAKSRTRLKQLNTAHIHKHQSFSTYSISYFQYVAKCYNDCKRM